MGEGIKLGGLLASLFMVGVVTGVCGTAAGAQDPLYRSPTGLTEIEMPHAWCYAWGDRTLSCVPK